jgi:hypothetical protein
MLDYNTLPRQCPVNSLLLIVQRMQFGFLRWGLAVGMDSCYALITGIREQENVRRQFDPAFFEEPEIMFAARAEVSGKNFLCLHIRKYLRFLGMTFLFAAVLMPLFF